MEKKPEEMNEQELLCELLKHQNKHTQAGRIAAVGVAVLAAVLLGLLIPSAVIKSSPSEFVNIKTGKSPLWYELSAALLAAVSPECALLGSSASLAAWPKLAAIPAAIGASMLSQAGLWAQTFLLT